MWFNVVALLDSIILFLVYNNNNILHHQPSTIFETCIKLGSNVVILVFTFLKPLTILVEVLEYDQNICIDEEQSVIFDFSNMHNCSMPKCKIANMRPRFSSI